MNSSYHHRTVSFYPKPTKPYPEPVEERRLASDGGAFGSPMAPDHPAKAPDQRTRSSAGIELMASRPPAGYDRSAFAGSSDDEDEPSGDSQRGGPAQTRTSMGTGRPIPPNLTGVQVTRDYPTTGPSANATPAPLLAPAAPSQPGLLAVQQSLQDMLATATRIHGQLLASGSSGAPGQSVMVPGSMLAPTLVQAPAWIRPPPMPQASALWRYDSGVQSLTPFPGNQRAAGQLPSLTAGPSQGFIPPVGGSSGTEWRASVNSYGSAIGQLSAASGGMAPRSHSSTGESANGSGGGSSVSGKQAGAAQGRGPLEALRDEIFGGFSVPAPATVQPAPGVAATVAPMAVRQVSGQLGGAGSLSSPTASARDRSGGASVHEAGHTLQDEHSTITTSQAMQSVADLSSIYSMPESALNAVANTPMSFTTAAVSELDTPSSPRSHGDEDLERVPSASPRSSTRNYAQVSPGGTLTPSVVGVGRIRDIASGYDDYVQPAAWTSLRERHSVSQTSAMATSTASPPRSTARTGAGTRGDGVGDPAAAEASLAPESGTDSPSEQSPDAAAHNLQAQSPQAPLSVSTSLSGPGLNSSPEFGLASISSFGSEYPPQPRLPFGAPQTAASPSSPLGSVGDAARAEGSSVQTTPTSARGFGSMVAASSGGEAGIPSGSGRHQSGSGHILRSLSFGIQPSGVDSRPGSALTSHNGGEALAGAFGSELVTGGDAADTSGTRASSGHLSAAYGRFGAGLSPLGGAQGDDQALLGGVRQTPRAGDDDGTPARSGLSFVNPLFAVDSSPPEGQTSSGGLPLNGDNTAAGDCGGAVTLGLTGAAEPAEDYRHAVEERPSSGRVVGLDQQAGRRSLEESAAAGLRSNRPLSAASARSGSGQGNASPPLPPTPKAATDSASPRHLAAATLMPDWTRSFPTGGRLASLAEHGPDSGGAADSDLLPTVETGRSTSASASRLHSSPVISTASRGSVLGAPGTGPPSSGQQRVSLAPTPWLDAATAAAAVAAADVGTNSPRQRGSAVTTLASIGGASSFSGMSAAAVSAMPSQDRVERVRTWAEEGADFGALPQGSTSMGGMALETPSTTSDGGAAATTARSPSSAVGSGPLGITEPGRPFAVGTADFESPGGESVDGMRITPRVVGALDHVLQPGAGGAGQGKDAYFGYDGMASPMEVGFAGVAARTACSGNTVATLREGAAEGDPAPLIDAAAAQAPGDVRAEASTEDDEAEAPQVVVASTGATLTEEPAAQGAGSSVDDPPASAAAITADLEQLLSVLSGRGARSEVHPRHQAGLDSLASAVVEAAGMPRPNSAPGLASMAPPEASADSGPLAPDSSVALAGQEPPSGAVPPKELPPLMEHAVAMSPVRPSDTVEDQASHYASQPLLQVEPKTDQEAVSGSERAREESSAVFGSELLPVPERELHAHTGGQVYNPGRTALPQHHVPQQPNPHPLPDLRPHHPHQGRTPHLMRQPLAQQLREEPQQPLPQPQQQDEPWQRESAGAPRPLQPDADGANQQRGQPHAASNSQPSTVAQQPQQLDQPPPQSHLLSQVHALNGSASLASIDSEFAVERLKAKTRAFLAAPSAAGGEGTTDIRASWEPQASRLGAAADMQHGEAPSGVPGIPPSLPARPAQAPNQEQAHVLRVSESGTGSVGVSAMAAPVPVPSSLDDILQGLRAMTADAGRIGSDIGSGPATGAVDAVGQEAMAAVTAIAEDGGRKRRSSSGRSNRSTAREAARADWQREQERLQEELWLQRQVHQGQPQFQVDSWEQQPQQGQVAEEAHVEDRTESPTGESESWRQELLHQQQQQQEREELEARALAALLAIQQQPSTEVEASQASLHSAEAAGRLASMPFSAGSPNTYRTVRNPPSVGSLSLRGSWASRGSQGLAEEWNRFPGPNADNGLADLSPWPPESPSTATSSQVDPVAANSPLGHLLQAQRRNVRSPNRRAGPHNLVSSAGLNQSRLRPVLARIQQEPDEELESQLSRDSVAPAESDGATSSTAASSDQGHSNGGGEGPDASTAAVPPAPMGTYAEGPASSHLDLTVQAAQLRQRLEATSQLLRTQEPVQDALSQDQWPRDPRLQYFQGQQQHWQEQPQRQEPPQLQFMPPQPQFIPPQPQHPSGVPPLPPRGNGAGGGQDGAVVRAPQAAHPNWQAALQAKLLPPDAIRKRASFDGNLVMEADGLRRHGNARHAPTAGHKPRSGSNGPAQQAPRHSRQASPAGARQRQRPPTVPAAGVSEAAGAVGVRQAVAGVAIHHSAPIMPQQGISPSRVRGDGPSAVMAAAPVGAPGGEGDAGAAGVGAFSGAADGRRSPRRSSSRGRRAGGATSAAGSGGVSILDRAASRQSEPAAAVAPSADAPSALPSRRPLSPPPHVSPLLPDEPISIRRPLAWQERETRNWLEDLGLRLTPAEESASLLDNPLRNGTLLAAVAATLTGNPLPPGLVSSPPTDVRSARTNILCALDHLGLLAAAWEPPTDAAQRSRAYMAELAGAAGGAGGRSKSPGPPHNSTAPTAGSSGIIAIKALGSAGRGYALRLKERQLRAGPGLAAEVEGVLAGSGDAVWGLLNLIRIAVGRQRMAGAGASSGGARQAADKQRPLDVRGGPGVNGTTNLGPAPAVAAAGVSRPGSGGGVGGPASPPRSPLRQAQPQTSGSASPLRRPAAGAQAGGPAARGGGGGRGSGQVASGANADLRASFPGAPSSGGGAAAAGAPPTDGSGGLLYRPLYPRPAALPYSASQLAALESSLLRWLAEVGAISVREAAQGFAAVLPLFADGTLICWLASNLSGTPIVGAHRKPRAPAARRSNWLKAIAVLRSLPSMSRRCLAYEEALVAGERPALTGLLEDLHRAAMGAEPAPSTFFPDAQPYLPYVVPEPVVAVLPFERIALNRGAASPMAEAAPQEAGLGGRPPSPPPLQRAHQRPLSAERMPRRQVASGVVPAPAGGHPRPLSAAGAGAVRHGAGADSGANGRRGMITDYMVTPYKAALPPEALLAAAVTAAPGGQGAAARKVQHPTAAWGLEAYLNQQVPPQQAQQHLQRKRTPPRQAWVAEGGGALGGNADGAGQLEQLEAQASSPRLRLVPTAAW